MTQQVDFGDYILDIAHKSTYYMNRDILEIGNLSGSGIAGEKFALSSYKNAMDSTARIVSGNYNMIFDEGYFANKPDSKIFIYICPISNMVNFSKAIENFHFFIAVCEILNGEKFEDFDYKNSNFSVLSSIALNPINGKYFLYRKNRGILYNNRRLRLAKTSIKNTKKIMITADNFANLVNIRKVMKGDDVLLQSYFGGTGDFGFDIFYLCLNSFNICYYKMSSKASEKKFNKFEIFGKIIEDLGGVFIKNGHEGIISNLAEEVFLNKLIGNETSGE